MEEGLSGGRNEWRKDKTEQRENGNERLKARTKEREDKIKEITNRGRNPAESLRV